MLSPEANAEQAEGLALMFLPNSELAAEHQEGWDIIAPEYKRVEVKSSKFVNGSWNFYISDSQLLFADYFFLVLTNYLNIPLYILKVPNQEVKKNKLRINRKNLERRFKTWMIWQKWQMI